MINKKEDSHLDEIELTYTNITHPERTFKIRAHIYDPTAINTIIEDFKTKAIVYESYQRGLSKREEQ